MQCACLTCKFVFPTEYVVCPNCGSKQMKNLPKKETSVKSAKTPKDFPNQDAYEQWANREWLAGRYCIGCQAVGVKTDYSGHCASCAMAYDQQWKNAQKSK